jgi:Ca2+-binding RTX toxin-like protein
VGTGNGLDNLLQGGNGHDTLSGLDGVDTLRGNAGNDILLGGEGDDRIYTGAGRDTATGGAGRDVFYFGEGDSAATRGGADVITDFIQADAEKIRLDQIDANVSAGGNQVFNWIGDAAFTGAGQLRYVHAAGNTYIEGDTDGDGTADFVLALTGTIDLVAADFIL